EKAQYPIHNPPGLRIRLITSNTSIPDSFETTAKRKLRLAREQREREARAAEDARQQLEWDYEDYREGEIDRWIAANPAEFEAIKNAEWEKDRQRFSFTTESMARVSARHEIRKRISFLTFDQFVDRRRTGVDLSL